MMFLSPYEIIESNIFSKFPSKSSTLTVQKSRKQHKNELDENIKHRV